MNSLKINRKMLEMARRQFCLDICLDWQQYAKHPERKVYIQKTSYGSDSAHPAPEGARCYAGTDAFFKAIMCMGQLFLSVDEQIYDWAVEAFADCKPEWFCAYDNLRKIDNKLHEFGREIKDTHVYFLPEDASENAKGTDNRRHMTGTQPGAANTDSVYYHWYNQEEILNFKENNCFTSAICFSPTQPDVLAVAAVSAAVRDFDQSRMQGMAGVSEDGAYLWQIGINVVPEHGRKGLAADLVRRMKEAVLERGKVPFYGTSESHTISQTVGLKAGFVPAWTEIYVRKIEK